MQNKQISLRNITKINRKQACLDNDFLTETVYNLMNKVFMYKYQFVTSIW